ncbi:helix-turn-helix transcriptional regulator [Agrobacterium rosae]|uniref:AraC family transcriptional regulator n=1 Tax=Agrobacterium rosae TaxID=1972867 RepID=UPI0019D4117A|nr:helix-turn-helix transcriptional regulator [Agrobacterium rosae]MBN7806785.1 helix-turn-helix transcriptional regulator [Agrobacterium rosae]
MLNDQPQGLGFLRSDEHDAMLSFIDGNNESVLALRRLYPEGFKSPVHLHRKTQLWFAHSGVVIVSTGDGRWMIPPGHGLIIPAGLHHSSEMISDVEMHSVYVHRDVIKTDRPRVVEVTVLAGNLIEELVRDDLNRVNLRRRELVMELLMDEISRLPEQPLGLPFPSHPNIAALCRHFLSAPEANASIDDWAQKLGMSRRTFTRVFRAETGVSFVTWRQQACIFASLPRLASGEAVTNVALDAGYENVSAFTTMFRRMLGSSPSAYLKSSGMKQGQRSTRLDYR